MKFPRITIITPSYNQGRYLESTIDSIVGQKYPNLEFFVMDGGSTDNSVEILRRHERHLSYWESIKDRGQSHAINKGLERATGEIVNWINSDDQLEEGALKKVAELYLKTKPQMILGTTVCKDTDGKITHQFFPKAPSGVSSFIHGGFVMAQPSAFLRRDLFDGQLRVREDLHCLMDWELYLRWVITYGSSRSVETTRAVLATSLSHGEAKTTTLRDKFREEYIQILREYVPRTNFLDAVRLRHHLATLRVHARVANLKQPSCGAAAVVYVRSIVECPTVLFQRWFWGAVRRDFLSNEKS